MSNKDQYYKVVVYGKQKGKKPIGKKLILVAIAVLGVFGIIASMVDDGGETQKKPDPISAQVTVSESTSSSEMPSDDVTAPKSDMTPEQESKDESGGLWSFEQINAMAAAKRYLNYTAFSHDGLVNQLEYEKYSNDVAVWAADNCGADWNEQARLSAKNYLNNTAFSYTGLINQLEYEGFTTAEATYGADNCAADWNEQAALSAKNYLKHMSFSRQSLIEQLMYEGFTAEQAAYGVAEAGY